MVVALGIDLEGQKRILGFWKGATANQEIAAALLADLERRGLPLTHRILFVTDGGAGIIKALKARFGKKLVHQRWTIHKDRNLRRHLPQRWRKAAHRRFRMALEPTSSAEAKALLLELEQWLRRRNESAAASRREAFEELRTLHRRRGPALLRRTLPSSHPIESRFSTVRDCEGNIRRYRSSTMAQRWLAAVCLHAEPGFRRVKGVREIAAVIQTIDAEQAAVQQEQVAA